MPDAFVKTGRADFLVDDDVRPAQDLARRLGHRTEHAHSVARTGERLPPEHVVGQPAFGAQRTHLVLEQLAQRLDELELHFLGQAAHIVVRFNRGRGSFVRDRLDDVGVQRSLDQVIRAAQLVRFFVEDGDKLAPDDFAFLLGILDAGQLRQESLGSVHHDQVHLEGATKQCLDLHCLARAQ